MKDETYVNIQGWMVNDLKLKGNELIVYAIISGFSQDGQTHFTGSLQYLADWTNSTKQSVINNLNSLIEKDLIEKVVNEKNGVRFCEYYSKKFNTPIQKSLMGYSKNLNGGIQKSLPNNIIYNIEDNIGYNIERKNTLDFNSFMQKWNIQDDNTYGKCNSVLINIDWDLLDSAFNESKFLQNSNYYHTITAICKDYYSITAHKYKDNKQEINKDDLWEQLDNALMWTDSCKQDLKYDNSRQGAINKITSYFEKLPENVKNYVGSKWYNLVDLSNKRRDFEKSRFYKEIK